MRKLLVILICFISCLFVGCNENKEPPVDVVLSIDVCSDFKDEKFYLNDVISLNDYTVLVTYKSGRTETINLASFGISVLDTSEVGNKTLNFKYEEKDFSIAYTVLEILPINAMYKGDPLEFFKDEIYDFSDVKVSVLYNNGSERNINLTDFNIGSIDYTLSPETKTFVATYQGVSVNIKYKIICPINAMYKGEPLEFFKDETYDFSDVKVSVLYNNGSERNINLTEFNIGAIDYTLSPETKTFVATFEGISVNISYKMIYPIQATYKGEILEIYRNENYDFGEVLVSVLYSNGSERVIDASELEISNIDYSLSVDIKNLVATFENVSANVPYTVTNRPIEENVDYNLCDNLDIFTESSIKIRFVGDKYIVHSGIDVPEEKPNLTVTKYDFNRYWTLNVKDNKLYKIAFYLVNDTIYCEIIEEIK